VVGVVVRVLSLRLFTRSKWPLQEHSGTAHSAASATRYREASPRRGGMGGREPAAVPDRGAMCGGSGRREAGSLESTPRRLIAFSSLPMYPM
jgi:hypothetical protein